VSRQQQSRPERKARTAQEKTVNASWCAPFALRGPEVAKRAYESTLTVTVRLESVAGWSFGKLKGLFRRSHLMPNGLLYWSRRSASSTRFGTKIAVTGYPNGHPKTLFWLSKWLSNFTTLDIQMDSQIFCFGCPNDYPNDYPIGHPNGYPKTRIVARFGYPNGHPKMEQAFRFWLSKWLSKTNLRVRKVKSLDSHLAIQTLQ
jgi:hypothetical protein